MTEYNPTAAGYTTPTRGIIEWGYPGIKFYITPTAAHIQAVGVIEWSGARHVVHIYSMN